MAQIYPEIDQNISRFIGGQKMFFVATAPLAGDGHVNLSPKGLDDTFALLGPRHVAYLDLTGSGIETIAHLRENGRIVLLFCAFESFPKIVRLHGKGRVVQAGTPEFEQLSTHFPAYPGARAIVLVDVTRVSDSCGYGVPEYKYEGRRKQIGAWSDRKLAQGKLACFQQEHNCTSIDGLPGLILDEA